MVNAHAQPSIKKPAYGADPSTVNSAVKAIMTGRITTIYGQVTENCNLEEVNTAAAGGQCATSMCNYSRNVGHAWGMIGDTRSHST